MILLIFFAKFPSKSKALLNLVEIQQKIKPKDGGNKPINHKQFKMTEIHLFICDKDHNHFGV